MKAFYVIFCVLMLGSGLKAQELQNHTPGLPATDALGRKLPTHKETGDIRNGKFVGLFYWTWLTNFARNPSHDLSEFLTEHPQALRNVNDPAWPDTGEYFHWGEPLFGYYRSTDEWVLRKHAEMLGEAGIDVIIFDCTNGSFTWKESYMQLCKVFSQARKDGVKTPQIAFMLAFGPNEGSKKAIEEIYADLYKPGTYQDLFFLWKGKPLIMAYPDNVSPEIRQYFTFRPGQPVYNEGPWREDHWGWLEIYPQHKFGVKIDGSCEQMTVGVSQNWSAEKGLSAMNAPNTFGRSYTHAHGQNTDPGAVNYGLNFQEQWDHALKADPEFIFITGWNEWVAGRQIEWQGQKNAFPDQFDQEKSRDVEPMKGGHGDNYYYQMIANIRKFKGMPKEPEPAAACGHIKINGKFDDWEDVRSEFLSHKGNTLHRNSEGFKGTFYQDNTGRNDIVRAKVAHDAKNLYFYVETAEDLTPSSDPKWMRLLIDTDRNKNSGWEGYDFIINRLSPSKKKAVLEKSNSNEWYWTKVGSVTYKVSGNRMEIKIPLLLLGLTPENIDIELKWSDNMQEDGNIMDFLVHGDVAPLGRFNYVYRSAK